MIQTGGGKPAVGSGVKVLVQERGDWRRFRALARFAVAFAEQLSASAKNSLTRSGGFGGAERLTHFSDHAQTIHEKRCAVNS